MNVASAASAAPQPVLTEGRVTLRPLADAGPAAWRRIHAHFRDPEIDYAMLAGSMGMAAQRITDPQAFAPALRAAVASGAPNLIEVMVADGFGG